MGQCSSNIFQRVFRALASLLAVSFVTTAAAQVTSSVTIDPASPGTNSSVRVTATLGNPAAVGATLSQDFQVFMPAALPLNRLVTDTCGGARFVASLGTMRAGTTIPAGSQCVAVWEGIVGGALASPILWSALVTSQGTAAAGSLTVTLNPLPGPTFNFGFQPAATYVASPTVLSLNVTGFETDPSRTTSDLTISLPAGMRVFAGSGQRGSCTGVQISGSVITLPVGSVLPPGGCSIVYVVELVPPVNDLRRVATVSDLSLLNLRNMESSRIQGRTTDLFVIGGSSSLFVMGERNEPITGGNGIKYRTPFGGGLSYPQAFVAPILESIDTDPPDYSILGRSISPDGTVWEFVLSNFELARALYGTDRLNCVSDTTNQCLSFYSGINPVSQTASRAGMYISRTPPGGTPQQCRVIDSSRSRFVVLNARYAQNPRGLGLGEEFGLNEAWEPLKQRARSAGISTLQTYTAGRRVTDVINFAFDFDVWCLDGSEAASPPGGRAFGAIRWLNDASNSFFAGGQRRGDDILFRRNFGRKLDETLVYVRGSGDSIVGGDTVYSAARADITARPLNGDILRGVSFRAVGPRLDLSVDIAAAFSQVLTTNCRGGSCFNHALARRASSKDDRETGIDVRINGRSCTALTGGFAIREAFFDGNQVDRFAADLDFQCAGEGPSRVEIRFNSDISWNDADEDGITDGAETSSLRNDFEPDNYLLPENTIDGNVLFARQQFRDFLAQEGSIGAYTRIGFEMDAGVSNRTDVAVSFFNSAEFYNVAAPVARMYQSTLGRYADAAGLHYWVTRFRSLNRPITLVDMASLFITSQEFVATYGGLGNQAFVERLYLNVLRRAGDSAGVAFWTGQLNVGQITRAQLVVAFSESPEFRTLTQSEVDVVLVYYAMLRRDVGASSFSSWVSQLNNRSLSTRQLIETVWRSQEYCYRFVEASYCRSVSPPTVL